MKVSIPQAVLAEMKQHLAAGRKSDGAATKHFWHFGQLLNEQSANLPHGSKEKWYWTTFQIKELTAQRYKRLAKIEEDSLDAYIAKGMTMTEILSAVANKKDVPKAGKKVTFTTSGKAKPKDQPETPEQAFERIESSFEVLEFVANDVGNQIDKSFRDHLLKLQKRLVEMIAAINVRQSKPFRKVA